MCDERSAERRQAAGDRIDLSRWPQPHVLALTADRSGREYFRDDQDPDIWIRRHDAAETTTSNLIAEEWPLTVSAAVWGGPEPDAAEAPGDHPVPAAVHPRHAGV